MDPANLVTKSNSSNSLLANGKRRLSETADSGPLSTIKKPRTSLVLVLGGANASTSTGNSTSNAEMPKKKKDGKERTKSINKIRGPTSPSTHCCVPNATSLTPCSRSLTCKTHSMALKRAVNRPRPFDILLHEWQKLNKPELFGETSKPVQPRVGNGSEAYLEASTRKRSGEKKKKKVVGVVSVGEMEEEENQEEDSDMIDSDEEMESVMRGIARGASARPLWTPTTKPSFFVGRNVKLGTLRGTLSNGVFGSLRK